MNALGFFALSIVAFAGRAQEDVADVPSAEHFVDENPAQRYFLHGGAEEAPKKGYRLLVVLPGGTGDADFAAFVKRIWKNALSEKYLVAQLVRPHWSDEQAKRNVWPLKKRPANGMEFSTEEFIDAVIADVEESQDVDPEHVFALGWSSSGPAVYSYALDKKTRLTGAFVAMSVFKPGELPSLKTAKGRPFYLLQSPEDTTTKLEWAKDAEKQLAKKKAEVQLTEYEGGHGWHGDVFGRIRTGVEWLERKHAKPTKR